MIEKQVFRHCFERNYAYEYTNQLPFNPSSNDKDLNKMSGRHFLLTDTSLFEKMFIFSFQSHFLSIKRHFSHL